MKVLLSLLALLAATPALAVDDPTRMIPTVSAGQVQSWPAMDGGTAGPMTVWIWTPPGYGKTPGKRYPVLYMHDGQNLFDKRLTKFNQEWGMDETIPRMARKATFATGSLSGCRAHGRAIMRCSRRRFFRCSRRPFRKG